MKERRSATIADVARHAGVSVGSVSHVLSGRTKVSDKLRERIMRAVAELSYTPNFHAQGLRQGTSFVVGLCLPHSRTSYMCAMQERIEEIAADAGYVLLHVFSRQDPAVEARRVKELMKFNVDGIILFTTNVHKDALDYIAERGLPTVLIDRSNDDDRFDQVVRDNRAGMIEAVNSLVEFGHRRLLFVFRSRRIGVTKHRLEGVRAAEKAMKKKGVKITQLEFLDDHARLQRELKAVFDSRDRPTAVITSNSDQAATILRFLNERKLKIPDEVSLVTFDEPDWSTLVSPQLSVIMQPAGFISEIAWTLLMQRINEPDSSRQKVTLKPDLVIRGSIGPVPEQS